MNVLSEAVRNAIASVFRTADGSPPLVLNDNFNATDGTALDGWIPLDAETEVAINPAGVMEITNGDATAAAVSKEIAVNANSNYIFEITTGAGVPSVSIGTTAFGTDIVNSLGMTEGTNLFSFSSGANASVFINLEQNSAVVDEVRTYSLVKVQESLVENGTFDRVTTGWTPVDCTIAIVASELEITGTSAVGSSWVYQDRPVTVGQPYHIETFYSGGTRVATACSLRVNDTLVGNEGNLVFEGATAADQVLQDTFVPTSTPIRVLMNVTPTIGETALFDNIILTEVQIAANNEVLPVWGRTLKIPDTTNTLLMPEGNRVAATQWRFAVVGAGVANILPVFKGELQHASYNVQNDSLILELSQVQNFKIGASGGDVTVIATALN